MDEKVSSIMPCQLRGRKAKAQQTSQLHPGQLFFPGKKRVALGGIETHSLGKERSSSVQR